jgi:hypothetical protein
MPRPAAASLPARDLGKYANLGIRIDIAKHAVAGARKFEYERSYIMHGLRELHLEITAA